MSASGLDRFLKDLAAKHVLGQKITGLEFTAPALCRVTLENGVVIDCDLLPVHIPEQTEPDCDHLLIDVTTVADSKKRNWCHRCSSYIEGDE